MLGRSRKAAGEAGLADGVLWLDDPAARDPAVAGGKAASLAALIEDWPVPAGVCIAADTHRRASDGGGVPAWARTVIAQSYAALGRRLGSTRPVVAVRSSAIGEDSTDASFAGQHDTFLGIVGADAVVDAVARCWASAHSDRALAYRRARSLEGPGAMAVLVQQLVDADVSAVVFSANPVTGNRDEILINASWGLGEAVVAGAVTPDTYVLRRDLQVTAYEIADKDVMIARRGVRTREVPVDEERRKAASLSHDQVRDLGRLALELEAATGLPVDLECAFRGADLFLLQCRPVTTFGPSAGPS